MIIRFAKPSDAEVIERLEIVFCAERGLPPERSDGVKQFLGAGGHIFLCEDEAKIHSAFWVISLENLSVIEPEGLTPSSPLRAIANQSVRLHLGQHGLFVFSWTPIGSRGMWLFRYLFRLGIKKFYGKRVVGFVAVNDLSAIRNYLQMGCRVVSFLPQLYQETDAHYMLEYLPGLSRCISRAAAGAAIVSMAELVKSKEGHLVQPLTNELAILSIQ